MLEKATNAKLRLENEKLSIKNEKIIYVERERELKNKIS
jgi:hypothetical protein